MGAPHKKNYYRIIDEIDEEHRDETVSMAKAIAIGRKDPVFFAEHFLGVKLHPGQKIFIWLTTKTRIEDAHELARAIGTELPALEKLIEYPFQKNILVPSNRFGKTFLLAIKHIWYNFYKIGAEGPPDFINDIRYATLNISPHSLQVDAAYRYIVDIFESKFIYKFEGKMVRNHCKISEFMVDHKQVKREIIFGNNSKIKGVPTGEDQAASLAGTNFFYISYDEAPQSRHLREELPAKILSRLIDSGGPLDIVGTPEVDNPSHVYYSRIAKKGLKLEDGFFTMTGKMSDNIFLGAVEREQVLKAILQTDPAKYRQVAFGEFITSGAKLFDNIIIEQMWTKEPWLPAGIPGQKYIMSIDWGFSDTGDPTVIRIFDYTLMHDAIINSKDLKANAVFYKQVFKEKIRGGSPYEVLARVRILQADFYDAAIIHDSTSMGGVVIKKMLRELGVRHVYDFSIARSPKEEMLFLTVRAMSSGRRIRQAKDGKILELEPVFGKIRSPYDPDLEEQLGNYRIDDKKLEQDDVMAFCMALWYLEKKYSGHVTKVFDLNILADRPEQIMRNRSNNVPVRALNIKEKIF